MYICILFWTWDNFQIFLRVGLLKIFSVSRSRRPQRPIFKHGNPTSYFCRHPVVLILILFFRKCLKIPPKTFVTRLNDFGRVSFNGKFYQSLLILQAFIFMSRKHSVRFEFIFYSILFLFIAYFTNIYFYNIKTLPSWNLKKKFKNLKKLWFFKNFRMSSGPSKDEILDVLPKELTNNIVTQKDREKYSHILRKYQ